MQGVQAGEPSDGAKLPAAHATQLAPPGALEKPMLQGSHVAAPGATAMVPGAQGTQLPAPARACEEPAGQGVQADAPGALKDPALQDRQPVAPKPAA